MNTKRSKRWDGKIDTLTADYLKDVVTQMKAYGDRVQFALNGPGQKPHYQVINSFEKKMAFDSNNHLLHPGEDEFVGANATPVLTLAQIETAIANVGVKRVTTTTRAVRSVRGSSTPAARPGDLIDIQKYEYFKNNVQKLPEGIRAYSQDITNLMKKGMTAEAAFGEIVEQYF
ncbi:hypothetical protein ACFQPC_03255 [Herminiimonas glaciei]|uniref:Uncharacterized protein n=1 Tax=Herminiimonas glaciei TaxID=523788 RepID=A0ABW2I7R0_9BURK|nr:hypothetical protein [Janthinobacterium sp. Marseille]